MLKLAVLNVCIIYFAIMELFSLNKFMKELLIELLKNCRISKDS